MSLTSYRAAPPRGGGRAPRPGGFPWAGRAGGPGGDRLSRDFGRSTMGAGGFHGRVRDGIGCGPPAVATRSSGPPPGSLPGGGAAGLGAVCVCAGGGAGRGAVGRLPRAGVRAARAIRTGRLSASPRVHPRPIDVMVSHGPRGDLILRGASRLDAFSGYPVRTWLPGGAAGATTGAPEVRPSRSSRTGDSASQVSFARGR